MKISVDDIELFTLTDTQKKVIKNDVQEQVFEDDMRRRIKWVLLDEKYQRCFEKLKKEWEPRLKASGVTSVPLDDQAFAELVFSQPDYQNRSQRGDQSLNIEAVYCISTISRKQAYA